MIQSPIAATNLGFSDNLNARTALNGAVRDLRTGNGDELEFYHVDRVPSKHPTSALGKRRSQQHPKERFVKEQKSFAAMVKQAAEESVQERDRMVNTAFLSPPPTAYIHRMQVENQQNAEEVRQAVAQYLQNALTRSQPLQQGRVPPPARIKTTVDITV